jgi:hypothetical protein
MASVSYISTQVGWWAKKAAHRVLDRTGRASDKSWLLLMIPENAQDPSRVEDTHFDARSLTGSQFDAALRQLARGAARSAVNVSCIACERCEECIECTFCIASSGLARSHHCRDCNACTECTHCAACRACLACQHCVDCERCLGSAYLVRCVACIGCTYGFGCVGLSRRDFCILNQPYDRATYFAVVSRLARELRIVLP